MIPLTKLLALRLTGLYNFRVVELYTAQLTAGARPRSLRSHKTAGRERHCYEQDTDDHTVARHRCYWRTVCVLELL